MEIKIFEYGGWTSVHQGRWNRQEEMDGEWGLGNGGYELEEERGKGFIGVSG